MLRTLVMAGLASCLPAHAETEVQNLNTTVEKLLQRMAQLEAANKRLQSEVEQLSVEKDAAAGRAKQAAPDVAAEPGAAAGEAQSQAQADGARQPGRLEQALEGVSVGASVAMVSQRALRGTTEGDKSQLNYRADVEVEIPLAKVADVGESKLFFHVRAGQGEGLLFAYPTLTATPNSTAFFLQNSDDSATVIGQAWYQFTHPLAACSSSASSDS